MVGGNLDYQLAEFGAAYVVVHNRACSDNALVDAHLLFGLYAGQGVHSRRAFRLGCPVDADQRSRAHESQDDGFAGCVAVALFRHFGGGNHRMDVHLNA